MSNEKESLNPFLYSQLQAKNLNLIEQLEEKDKRIKELREALESAGFALEYYAKHYESAPTFRSYNMDMEFMSHKKAVRQTLAKLGEKGEE